MRFYINDPHQLYLHSYAYLTFQLKKCTFCTHVQLILSLMLLKFLQSTLNMILNVHPRVNQDYLCFLLMPITITFLKRKIYHPLNTIILTFTRNLQLWYLQYFIQYCSPFNITTLIRCLFPSKLQLQIAPIIECIIAKTSTIEKVMWHWSASLSPADDRYIILVGDSCLSSKTSIVLGDPQ